MIDGKGNRCAGCNIGRIRNFLKICFQSQSKREKQMVKHKQQDRQRQPPPKIINAPIGQKNAYQTQILKSQCGAFSKIADHAPGKGRKHCVQKQIHEKQPSHFMHFKSKPLYQHKAGKNHKNLTPCAGHKLKQIIKPIAPTQNHFLGLNIGGSKPRISNKAQHGNEHACSAASHVNWIIRKIKNLRSDQNHTISKQSRARTSGR